MNVVITIPALNEEENISGVIKEINSVMKNTSYKYKIIVVDDGSIDNTKSVAEKAGAKVFRINHDIGLTGTFRREMEECLKLGADIIVHTDADGQYPASFIPMMIKKVEDGNDLVLGSRFLDGKHHDSFFKMWGNVLFAKVISSLTKTKITDSTTGFRAFNCDVARNIVFINNFTYTQEQLIKASKLGFKIVEIPITRNKTRESRLFKNPIGYAFKAWINILRIYRDYDPLKFFGRIGLVFISAGLIVGVYLVFIYLMTQRVGHLPLTILSMLFILIGLQVIIFGFIADMKNK